METLTHLATTAAGALGIAIGVLTLVLVAAAPWLARHAQDGLPRPVPLVTRAGRSSPPTSRGARS